MNENKGVFGIWGEGEDMQKGSLVLCLWSLLVPIAIIWGHRGLGRLTRYLR